MKTILFPTDFSERANQALEQAITIAEKADAKLIIYHTYHRPVIEGEPLNQMNQRLLQLEEDIERRFQKLSQQNSKLEALNYEFRKELGVSIENIANVANSEEVHLIVMATKGAKGFGELWGTKTARIIKSVNVPVLVLPDNTLLDAINKVGLVCDYSEKTNYHTLDSMLKLVDMLQLGVDVITLNRDEKTMTHEEEANRQLVREKLKNVPATFHFTWHNKVEEGIIAFTKAHDIGMIAILPKSYSFIEKLFRESLTEKMAFHSPVPLLVLK